MIAATRPQRTRDMIMWNNKRLSVVNRLQKIYVLHTIWTLIVITTTIDEIAIKEKTHLILSLLLPKR